MAVSPEFYQRGFDERVRNFLPLATRSVPALHARLRGAGLSVDGKTTVADLDAVPILDKDELINMQRDDPPFGGLVAAGTRPRRVFQSPGPLYEVEPAGEDPWRWRVALEAAGFTEGDVVFNAFAYHLTPAGAMFEAACHALGGTVVPGGVGNLDLQARACLDLGVSAYIGLPSYLNALLEKADEVDLPGSLGFTRAFVTAEPLPPSLRDRLSERVATVRQGYGTAETGNLGYECEHQAGLHVPADALVQICDLTTGAALEGDGEGQVVVTVFSEDAPLVRFGTGDLSAWMSEPCPCGRPTPRISGLLGRVGEAVKVRGMFLHPRQVTAVMESVEGVAAFRLVVERESHRDHLRCEVEPVRGYDGEDVARSVKERVRSGLRFDATVTVVGSLDPGDGPIVDTRTWD